MLVNRHTSFKYRVPNQKGGCSQCGRTNGKGGLFEYHLKPDNTYGTGDRVIDGMFCSVGCLREFHKS